VFANHPFRLIRARRMPCVNGILMNNVLGDLSEMRKGKITHARLRMFYVENSRSNELAVSSSPVELRKAFDLD
jgi:hypothetical protein